MGTWKAGQSVIYTGIRHPSSVMKNVIPIVMAGGTLNSFDAAILVPTAWKLGAHGVLSLLLS